MLPYKYTCVVEIYFAIQFNFLCHYVGLRWMAPELLRCSNIGIIRRCDMQPADVYGFAMIVYEISTRKYPFEDEMENITATGNKSAFCFNMN